MQGLYLVDANGRKISSDNPLNIGTANPLDVQLTGSNVVGPKLLDTIPYSAFTASGTLYKSYSSLTIGAKNRTYFLTSKLNQPVSSVIITPFDSTAASGLGSWGGDGLTTAAINPNATYDYNGAKHPELLTNGNSIAVALTIGATVPTSGNFYIYVTEVM